MAWYNDVDSSKKFRLGTRKTDVAGNEYVYVSGVGSMVAGDWVAFDEAYGSTRLIADEVGPVGVAMGAIDATTKYGWLQIYGVCTIALTDTVAADLGLYTRAAAGFASDSDVAGEAILGAFSMTADTAGVTTVFLNRPEVGNRAID